MPRTASSVEGPNVRGTNVQGTNLEGTNLEGTKNGALILLAAGSGTRFGSDKRAQAMATGSSLLATTLALYQDRYDKLVVVLRPGDEQIGLELTASKHNVPPVQVVYAAQATQGMGHSLACAADVLLAATSSALGAQVALRCVTVALADMPYVQAATLQQLQSECASLTAPFIVQPTYQGKPGNPVAFSANYLHDFSQLSGDQGARSLVRSQQAALHLIAVDDPGVLQDIDRPQDIRR